MRLRARTVTVVLASCCGSAAVAQPPTTELRYEVRKFDPGHNSGWASSVNALPGDHIEVRALVSYTGTQPVVALGQITFQPTVANWSSDILLTNNQVGQGGLYYAPDGIGPSGGAQTTPSGNVADAPGVYGRVTPFGTAVVQGSGGTLHYRGFTHTVSGTSYLRIARSDVTNWFGVGATSGAEAINNTNGVGGVSCWQGSLGTSRPTNVPSPIMGTQNILVFKFGFRLSPSPTPRELRIFTPDDGFGTYTGPSDYGGPGTTWFLSADENGAGSYRTNAVAVDALVHVIPTPASLALLSLAAACSGRRRRTIFVEVPCAR